MNKSDKYYLKQGRLELSMLDEDDDEFSQYAVDDARRQTSQEQQLFFEHTKRLRDTRSSGQAKVKVSQEIYSTLHTMGQYLTRNDDKEINGLPVKKPVNSAKAQLIEQLASSVKVQDMTLPPMPSREERLNQLSITKADEIVEKQVDLLPNNRQEQSDLKEHEDDNKWFKLEKEAEYQDETYEDQSIDEEATEELDISTIQEMEAFKEQQLQQEETIPVEGADEVEVEEKEQQLCEHELVENPQENVIYHEDYNDEMEQVVVRSYESAGENCNYQLDNSRVEEAMEEHVEVIEEFEDRKSIQKKIDKLLESFFDKKMPQYSFTKDLKRHIDKHIAAIKEQKTNFTN